MQLMVGLIWNSSYNLFLPLPNAHDGHTLCKSLVLVELHLHLHSVSPLSDVLFFWGFRGRESSAILGCPRSLSRISLRNGLEGLVRLVLRVSRQRPPGECGLRVLVGHWRVLSTVDTLRGAVKRSGGSGVGEGWGRNQQKKSCISICKD